MGKCWTRGYLRSHVRFGLESAWAKTQILGVFRNACFERWRAFVLLAWPVLAWAEHWAFVPPQKEPLPTVRNVDWPSNDLDRFILAKLEAVGVAPAKQASRPALCLLYTSPSPRD